MGRHKYRIIINRESKAKADVYDFGHTKGINLKVSKQKVTIEFEMTLLKELSDFTGLKFDLFNDAYKKAYLIHAIRYSEGLIVNSIQIFIDGDAHCIEKDSDTTGHFPYMFSMITSKKLNLNNKWKTIETEIIKTTKTQSNKDLRFSAIYAFLASKSREYEIDRFGNLWTAMNAFYTFLVRRCNEIHELNIKRINDARAIKFLACLIESESVNIPNDEEKKEKWKNNYRLEEIVKGYKVEDYEDLYEASIQELKGEGLTEKYHELSEIANEFGVKLFSYILLVFAYRIRCEFFHGEVNTLLIIGYNDYKIHVLEMVNYFIDRFLTEKISFLFTDDFSHMIRTDDAKNYLCKAFNIKEKK